MKSILVTLFLTLSLSSFAQLTFNLKGTVHKKIRSELAEGTQVTLTEIVKVDEWQRAIVYVDKERHSITVKDLEDISFVPSNSREFWQHQAVRNGVYENVLKAGMQYKLRREQEEEAIDYLNYVEETNMVFEDSYLESYLYSLIYKIYPSRLDDGRPGILNVRVLKDMAPNAFIFPNGSMFVTTGLLSIINSEEELVAVLAHEISHFVLDHSIININKAVERQKRAEFWAAFVTGIAAVADGYVSSSNEYYTPGTITRSAAIIAYSMADAVNERMGLKFSREQEMEADKCAVELLKYIDVSPAALSSALSKIRQYCVLTGDYMALTGEGTHPAIDYRIRAIGEPASFSNKEYDRKISFVNTLNAIVELNNQHFESSLALANRNIEANVPTEEDYLILAMSLTFMYNNEAKNNEALGLIRKARSLNVYPPLNLPKHEAIILIRLRRIQEAKASLEEYKRQLEKKIIALEGIKNTNQYLYSYTYFNEQVEWTVKMISKVDRL